jgi:hypothetical protein
LPAARLAATFCDSPGTIIVLSIGPFGTRARRTGQPGGDQWENRDVAAGAIPQFPDPRCAAGSRRIVSSCHDRDHQEGAVELSGVPQARGYAFSGSRPDHLPKVRRGRSSFPGCRHQVGTSPGASRTRLLAVHWPACPGAGMPSVASPTIARPRPKWPIGSRAHAKV